MARWCKPTQHLLIGGEVEPREIEEGQRVAVPDVEEEMGRAAVVAVLEDLGERELEDALVEIDRSLDIGHEQRHVVDAASRRRPAERLVT